VVTGEYSSTVEAGMLDKEWIFLLVKMEKNQQKSWMQKSASAPLDAKNSLS